MQKGKITDYEAFKNEINILMQLVGCSLSLAPFSFCVCVIGPP